MYIAIESIQSGGNPCGNCFISDEELRGKFMEIAEKSHAAESNAFVEAACVVLMMSQKNGC